MDAKARLDEIRDKLLERTRAKLEIDYSGRGVLTVNDVMQILLAAGVTVPEPEPEPPGPVTMKRWLPESSAGLFLWNAENVARELPGYTLGQEIRITIEDAATPSTLIPLAEVERRAREWWHGRDGRIYGIEELVAALTREAK